MSPVGGKIFKARGVGPAPSRHIDLRKPIPKHVSVKVMNWTLVGIIALSPLAFLWTVSGVGRDEMQDELKEAEHRKELGREYLRRARVEQKTAKEGS